MSCFLTKIQRSRSKVTEHGHVFAFNLTQALACIAYMCRQNFAGNTKSAILYIYRVGTLYIKSVTSGFTWEYCCIYV